jgi:transcriptional regulator with GAF, ATPase, and Fis domain
MRNPVDHTGEFRQLVELLGALGLTAEQHGAVLDGCRRELHEHAQRLHADLVATHHAGTGLGPAPGTPILPLRVAERRHLVAALRHTGGKIYGRDGAAKLLDLKPTTLQSKLKKHGINRLEAVGEDGDGSQSSSSGAGELPTSHPSSTPSTTSSAPVYPAE